MVKIHSKEIFLISYYKKKVKCHFSGGCLRKIRRPFLWSPYKYWITDVGQPLNHSRSLKDMHNRNKKPNMTFYYE